MVESTVPPPCSPLVSKQKEPEVPPTMNEKSKIDMKSPVEGTLPMSGGQGNYSYSKNSSFQRLLADTIKDTMQEEIINKVDIKSLTSASNTIRIVDMGCATGPNTFTTMQHFIEAIEQKYKLQHTNSPINDDLEFQVFFNDLPKNDFNTLFTSLPKEKKYFAVGVPGSFHQRLFPQSSIHFVHSAFALHWIAELPLELKDQNSLAWNKGRVHYTSAPEQVLKAYANQFCREMGSFLKARAEEVVSGGLMVLIFSGIEKEVPLSYIAMFVLYDYMACVLLELAKEGYIDESEVDSFNIPFYAPTPEEMLDLIGQNGNFIIERMDLYDPATWLDGPLDMRLWMMHIRAAMGPCFIKHFGNEFMDEFFERLIKMLNENSDLITSRCHEKVQLFIVLKRK